MLAAHPVSRTRRPLPSRPARLRIYAPACDANCPPRLEMSPPRSGEVQSLSHLMPQVLARYGIVKFEA
jgi:hypothetical protein